MDWVLLILVVIEAIGLAALSKSLANPDLSRQLNRKVTRKSSTATLAELGLSGPAKFSPVKSGETSHSGDS
ncbi:MAG TPA: hypothetical protein VI457_00975 [Methylococcaceae bacterium]|nr:hypothetical protein [Methylococcaceae bacterium]